MDTDTIHDRIQERLKEGVEITDEGIGHYEFWGATGVDSQITLDAERADLVFDIADCLDEGETPESVMAEGLSMDFTVSKSNGGDPDACAESGKRRCGSCTGCDEVECSFTVKLTKVEKKDDEVLAHFDVD